MWEYVIVLMLIVIFIVMGTTLFTSHRFKNQLASTTMTRGVNGNGGDNLTLTCPAGQSISFTNNNPTAPRVVLICETCNPYPSDQTTSFYNSTTTEDVSSQLSTTCGGKNSCTFSVPTTFTTSACSCPSGSVQIVGTYDCVA